MINLSAIDVWNFNVAMSKSMSLIHDPFLLFESNWLFPSSLKRFFYYFTEKKGQIAYYPSPLKSSAWKENFKQV